MPELPEVETVCRGLRPVLEGRFFKSITLRRKDLRFPLPDTMPTQLEGVRITGLSRRAKYILIHFENNLTLLVHLGMSGRMVIDANTSKPEKHDHVIFITDNNARIRFHDPRRFGMMAIAPTATLNQHPRLMHLGPEPLSQQLNDSALSAALKNRKTAIKLAIMDQALVVGVGNIYASEALFEAGIHPLKAAGQLTSREIKKLVPAIKDVLRRAIAKGGSSLRDYVQADGMLGYFQHEFAVYDRAGEACKNCNCVLKKTGGIQQITQGGRSTYFCPKKQRL